jgi:uncharacterized protein
VGARALFERAAARSATRGMTSLDPPATAVLLELTREAQDVPGKRALAAGLRALIERERAPLREVLLSGPPIFDDAFVAHTERDLGRLGPLALLLIFGVVVGALRRVSLALVPVAVVACAVLWTLGLMAALGLEVGLVSSNLVCVLLAVGIADGIHLVSEYRVQAARASSRVDAIARAAAAVFVPCAFAMLTTVAGMLSLASSEIRPVREFGLLAAGGVALAFLVTFVLGPVLLSVMHAGVAPVQRSAWRRIARLSPRGARLVLAASAALVGLACVGVSRLEVGVNPVEYFRTDDPLRRATERIDAAMGGTASVELQVEAPGAGFEDPARLARVAALRATLERERGVSYSQSALDPLVDLHRAWTGGGDLPTSRELLAQYYLLLEAEPDLERLLRRDHEAGRLSLRTQMSMVDRPLEVIARIERHAAAYRGDGLDVQVTGYVHLMASMYGYLLESQIQSALLAVPAILLAMLCLLRRPSLTLLALIPNVVPLIAALGLMGALGIRLDVGTVMVGSITLGLIVDDTVHLLVRLRENLETTTDPALVPAALERTLAEVGAPLVATSLAFMAGFAALTLGGFLVNVYFGLLSCTVILLAIVCDLLITPALVLALPRWFVHQSQ